MALQRAHHAPALQYTDGSFMEPYVVYNITQRTTQSSMAGRIKLTQQVFDFML